MGTDSRGRDIFSRLLWGARDTIGLPAVATTFAVFFGTIIGLSTGYLGGWFDEGISRIMDSLLAIPALVLALVMLTTIVPILNTIEAPGLAQFISLFGANNISLTLVIVLLYVPIVTRVVRSATLTVRDSGYIEAAKLRGESIFYILFSEILPSVLPALVVEGSLRLSYAIFLVASLGFLGLGVQPPSPEWGRMVLDSRDFITTAPWTVWFPVLAIATLIVSINLMSDGMRRVLRNEAGRE
jgi:peptide/nickel transport system permease protein